MRPTTVSHGGDCMHGVDKNVKQVLLVCVGLCVCCYAVITGSLDAASTFVTNVADSQQCLCCDSSPQGHMVEFTSEDDMPPQHINAHFHSDEGHGLVSV